MAKAFKAGGVHPLISAAMLAENIELICIPEFEGICFEEGIPFSKCARQGGMESPFAWNMVMHMVLNLLVPLWHESGYGFFLKTTVHAPDLGGQCVFVVPMS